MIKKRAEVRVYRCVFIDLTIFPRDHGRMDREHGDLRYQAMQRLSPGKLHCRESGFQCATLNINSFLYF